MTDWREFALCRDLADQELFFPVGEPGAPAYDAALKRAVAVCADCPVRTLCLDKALAMDVVGVWGGLDEAGRRALRRQRLRVGA